MSGQAWYRHNPRDFLDGVVGMTPDLIGAYIVTLDLIYARGGPIPNDQRWLGGVMGCSPRAATALVNRLIEAGKLSLINGKLSNVRAENELENSANISRNQAETGAKGGRKRVENEAKSNNINGKAQATLKPIDKIREDKKEEGTSVPSSARAEAQSVVAEWNGMATATGLPMVASLNPERTAKVRARLAEHGRDKVAEAIRKVGESPYCTGQVNGFKASFDFFLQPSSFLKIIEGNYDGHAHRNGNGMGGHRAPPARSPVFEGIERALARVDREAAAH